MTSKNYGSLKNTNSPKEESLGLTGAPAAAAVLCMRKQGVLPVQQTLKGSTSADVDLDKFGNITIEERGKDDAGSERVEKSEMDVGSLGYPPSASTPNVTATGPIAERMRLKARACAFKAISLRP